ncbi:MAG: A/G-specific adenine glycosylase [Elusimicrobia bacterium]|nr:A/G-specific adenine glycosylase [Elusimicrobiota bacterium]
MAALKAEFFRTRLLAWYKKHGRHDLPWRRGFRSLRDRPPSLSSGKGRSGPDPYRILVSELMLQQTGVQTVIPYFHRFLKRFPTFKILARAPQEKVLERWSGLGYYARARNLQKAAQKIVAEHAGRLPRTRAEVEDLPGVGPYTAGALLSFAYDQPEALVDGNVIRVLSRVYGIRRNTKEPPVLKKIWDLARTLVPPDGARHFNSALMDLGATVCKPASPDCAVCPLAARCWANRKGRPSDLPVVGADGPKKLLHIHAAIVEKGGRWLLRRRPATGLYAGLWEFPGLEFKDPPPTAQVARFLRDRFNAAPSSPRPLAALRHTLSHREIVVHPWRCTLEKTAGGNRWFPAKDINRLAISSLTRRVWQQVRFHV